MFFKHFRGGLGWHCRLAGHMSLKSNSNLRYKHLWPIAITVIEHTVCMSLLIYQYFIAFDRIVQNKSVYSFTFYRDKLGL